MLTPVRAKPAPPSLEPAPAAAAMVVAPAPVAPAAMTSTVMLPDFPLLWPVAVIALGGLLIAGAVRRGR